MLTYEFNGPIFTVRMKIQLGAQRVREEGQGWCSGGEEGTSKNRSNCEAISNSFQNFATSHSDPVVGHTVTYNWADLCEINSSHENETPDILVLMYGWVTCYKYYIT